MASANGDGCPTVDVDHVWNGPANRSDRAEREAPKATAVDPNKRAMKILFANKFFFLNGGSEVVMFDEMELMRKYALDVVEFSMHDPRNLSIEIRILFRLTKGLPVDLAKQPSQIRAVVHSFA